MCVRSRSLVYGRPFAFAVFPFRKPSYVIVYLRTHIMFAMMISSISLWLLLWWPRFGCVPYTFAHLYYSLSLVGHGQTRLQPCHFHYNGCVTLNPSFILCLWMTCVKNSHWTIDKFLCVCARARAHVCPSLRRVCLWMMFGVKVYFVHWFDGDVCISLAESVRHSSRSASQWNIVVPFWWQQMSAELAILLSWNSSFSRIVSIHPLNPTITNNKEGKKSV